VNGGGLCPTNQLFDSVAAVTGFVYQGTDVHIFANKRFIENFLTLEEVITKRRRRIARWLLGGNVMTYNTVCLPHLLVIR